MPAYEKQKDKKVITPEQFETMLSTPATKTKASRDKALLAMLWITGARPNELVKMKRKNIYDSTEHAGFAVFVIPNSKIATGKSNWLERTLIISKASPFFEHISAYINDLKPEDRLFPITPTRVRQIVYETSKDEACPYTFRHTRLTRLAWRKASEYQLKQWKGGGSVEDYLIYSVPSPPTVVD